jgi:bacterioferritin-associated ferredoxin
MLSLNAGEHYVCACLKLTQADLARAIQCLDIRTLKDLRNQTGAGDGCMACHRRLCCYLDGDRSGPGGPEGRIGGVIQAAP